MEKGKTSKTDFRHYKSFPGNPILKVSGKRWIPSSGSGKDNMHFHDYMEIGYCYDGKGILEIGEESYCFSEGQFSVIPENCPHTTVSTQGTASLWEHLFIDTEGVLCGVYPSAEDREKRKHILQQVNSKGRLYNAEKSPRMAGKLLQIFDIMHRAEEFYLEEARGILIAFLAELARGKRGRKENVEEPKKQELLSNALEYVSSHYMETIRIEELAGLCHISETHFRRIFSACMDMGALEYINLIRIQKACEMLMKSDALISDVAFQCGFSTLSTFYRNFRQITGSSPAEWKRNQKGSR